MSRGRSTEHLAQAQITALPTQACPSPLALTLVSKTGTQSICILPSGSPHPPCGRGPRGYFSATPVPCIENPVMAPGAPQVECQPGSFEPCPCLPVCPCHLHSLPLLPPQKRSAPGSLPIPAASHHHAFACAVPSAWHALASSSVGVSHPLLCCECSESPP